jgi:hypothetical protein
VTLPDGPQPHHEREAGIKEAGRALCSWVGGLGDVVAFLDNLRLLEKKEDIERIGEKVILIISSSLEGGGGGHLGPHRERT